MSDEYIVKVNCDSLDDRILQKCFRTLVLSYCDKNYPDEKNPLSDVSCGSVFHSKNAISCQIRLLNNGRFFFCRYLRDAQEVILEEYKMINAIKAGIFENEDNVLITGLIENGDCFDEVMLERKSKSNKPISYEIKHKPRKMTRVKGE